MSSLLNALLGSAPSSTSISTSATIETATSNSSRSNDTNTPSRHFPCLESLTALRAAGVPLSIVSEADCASCTQSCSAPMNMEGYPRAFSIDTTSSMLGTIKPFDHVILCSSGKTDWPHDVCENVSQVPGALRQANPKPSPGKPSESATLPLKNNAPPGIFPLPQTLTGQQPERPLKVTILSSSHISGSEDPNAESLIVLPEWVLLSDVTPSNVPKLPLSDSHQSFPLPHELIILLCSHKTRDKRCAIAAPLLSEALIEAIESSGPEWRVESRGDEILPTTDRLVGIFQVSHSGGHKFAGNMTIFFANGASIWYGRVTPSDCGRIVRETVVGHMVIPELLKGGYGLDSLKPRTLEW